MDQTLQRLEEHFRGFDKATQQDILAGALKVDLDYLLDLQAKREASLVEVTEQVWHPKSGAALTVEDKRIQRLDFKNITTDKIQHCPLELRRLRLAVRKYSSKARCTGCGMAHSKYLWHHYDERLCMKCTHKHWKRNKAPLAPKQGVWD